MASSFQRKSRTRKLIYMVAIVVLFTLTLLWRGTVFGANTPFWRYTIEGQADALELREQDLGETELTGSFIRLTLTGSRGFAVCVLWSLWNEAGKRQEWNEQEVLIGILTKLQPHFRAPWFFHAWHLAYNIPAECDRVSDKYFYISRGIQLAAEGERQNRSNPDFRHWIGWLYHNKLGSADEQNTLRSLFQLSCIPPPERDPGQLTVSGSWPDNRVDSAKFQKFCEAHPFLVRRLREQGGCKTPHDLLVFLWENRDLPTRYTASGRFKATRERFPVLPRRADLGQSAEYTAEDYALPDDFDNFRVAQVWMIYSQEPLPDPNDTDYDRMKYRMNRRMAPAIFRSYPAMIQTRYAERLQAEGWFDERGWVVDEGKQGPARWFPDRRVVIGAGRNWSGEAWTKARDLWTEFGRHTGLYLDPPALAAKERLAKKYREAFDVSPHELGPELRIDQETDEMKAALRAHRQLMNRETDRRNTNFAHYFAQARAECLPGAVAARRLFFQARQKASDPAEAIRLYERGLAEWKKVLDESDDYRADEAAQEETYKFQYDYLGLVKDHRGGPIKQLLVVQDVLAHGAAGAALVPLWLPTANLVHPNQVPPALVGPFDGAGPDGKPYVGPEAIRRARGRLGLSETSPTRQGSVKKSAP